MKTQNLFLLSLAAFSCTLLACTPPEEDVHPKRTSSRDENLKRYVSKAQELRAQGQQRSKPIVEGPLLTEDIFKEFADKTAKTDISGYLIAQQKQLQENIRSGAANEIADDLSKRLNAITQEAVEAVREADSAQVLTERLNQFAKRYSQELGELAQNPKQESWTLPTAQQSRQARENLRKAGEDLLKNVSDQYGSTCAQKVRPILAKAGDDYWLALSSVKNPDELQNTLEKIGEEADKNFEKTVAEYGDPVMHLSTEQAASVRARLIEAHQAIEQQFEKLYGKEAVLKTRNLFEPYLEETDELLGSTGRLSEKKARLEEIGAAYRQQVTALQVQLNDELEQKIAALKDSNNPSM